MATGGRPEQRRGIAGKKLIGGWFQTSSRKMEKVGKWEEFRRGSLKEIAKAEIRDADWPKLSQP